MSKETILILLVVGAGAFVLLSNKTPMYYAPPNGYGAGAGAPSNELQVGAAIASQFMPQWNQANSIMGMFGSGPSGAATADGYNGGGM